MSRRCVQGDQKPEVQVTGRKGQGSLWHHRAVPATQAPAAQAHHDPGHYNLWRARGVPTACSGTSAQTHEPQGLFWSCSHHCSLPSKETEPPAETGPRLLTQFSCHLRQASRPAAKHFFVFTGHHRHAGSACTFLLHKASPEVAPPAGTALLEPTAGQGVNYVCSHTVRGLRYQAKCYQMCGDLCQSDLQAQMPVWIFNMLVSGVRGSELGVSMQMLHIFSTLTITF